MEFSPKFSKRVSPGYYNLIIVQNFCVPSYSNMSIQSRGPASWCIMDSYAQDFFEAPTHRGTQICPFSITEVRPERQLWYELFNSFLSQRTQTRLKQNLALLRKLWWHKWLSAGILSGQAWFKSRDGLWLFQVRNSDNLFSLGVGLFLITCNIMVHTIPSFLFPIIIYHCKNQLLSNNVPRKRMNKYKNRPEKAHI